MPKGQVGTKAPHGTLTRYTTHSCRCRKCKDAKRDYEREKYGHRPLEIVNAERAATHGMAAKYRAGCRCDLCRKAATDERRARRHANIEATRAYDREYRRRTRANA